MGLQTDVVLPEGAALDWAAVQAKLNAIGVAASVKMIDNLPAFPDEVPEPGWNDLRLGLTAGMVTLRRTSEGVSAITWGSADVALNRARDAVAWAVAAVCGGSIREGGTTVTADAFSATRPGGPLAGAG